MDQILTVVTELPKYDLHQNPKKYLPKVTVKKHMMVLCNCNNQQLKVCKISCKSGNLQLKKCGSIEGGGDDFEESF